MLRNLILCYFSRNNYLVFNSVFAVTLQNITAINYEKQLLQAFICVRHTYIHTFMYIMEMLETVIEEQIKKKKENLSQRNIIKCKSPACMQPTQLVQSPVPHVVSIAPPRVI